MWQKGRCNCSVRWSMHSIAVSDRYGMSSPCLALSAPLSTLLPYCHALIVCSPMRGVTHAESCL